MTIQLLRKLYIPGLMVKEDLRKGELPGAKEAFSTGFGVAYPAIVETFFIALIHMVNTIMVSIMGAGAIAAVGIVGQPLFIVQTLVFSLNASVTAIAARRRGQGDADGAASVLKQGMLLSLIFSVSLSAIAYPLAYPFLAFTGAQSDIIDIAVGYFRILLLGVPITSLSMTISAAQRGTGNTRASMRINLVANIVTITGNFLLIGGNLGFPRLGVAGAGISTICGWTAGLTLAIISVSHKGHFLFLFTREHWRFDKKTVGAMYTVASGAFLEQICMRVGFFMYTRIVAGLGTTMFAAHMILSNIISLSFAFGEGFGISASSLVGQNLGAKRPDLSILYGKICQRMSLISSTVIFIILMLFGGRMVLLYSNDPEIIQAAGMILPIIGLIIYGQASQMIFMGSLRGAGDTRYIAYVSMVSIMILRPIIAYVLVYPVGLGLLGGWISFLFDQYLRLTLTFRRFSSGKWMNIRL
ncbi:MAG: MATE family efflux transporter [Oscillospiraceae bacterium]|nr:MATE family efflux transporter [Oscillospiraceae bacterium]